MKHEDYLITAGGKITCPRCQATSKRTKLQCGRPALRGKSVCDFHGGKSTGPKTAEGKEQSRQAHIKSGNYTQESRLRIKSTLLKLAYLEDAMHLVGLSSASRTRGPKPIGHVKFSSLDDLIYALRANQHSIDDLKGPVKT